MPTGHPRKLSMAERLVRERLGPQTQDGVPRDQVEVPIAITWPVLDNMRFADPNEPAKHYYLPRYRVKVDWGRYEVRFLAEERESWILRVHLEATVPAGTVGSDLPLEHELDVQLLFNLAVSGGGKSKRSIDFREIQKVEGGIIVSHTIRSVEERDTIFAALTSVDYETELRVTRIAELAVPALRGTRAARVGHIAARTNPTRPGRVEHVATRTNPTRPGRVEHVATRTSPTRPGRVEHVATRTNPTRPIRIENIATRTVPRPRPTEPAPPAPAEERYQVQMCSLPSAAEPQPFIFNHQLHAYVFQGLPIGAAAPLELTPRTVAFEGRLHTFLQDPIERNVFLYYPDEFRLVRWLDPPSTPALVLQFTASETDERDVTASLRYVAGPHVANGRLEKAAEDLQRFVPEGSPELVFLPFEANTASLHLALPGGDGVHHQLQEHATVSMGAIDGVINLPVTQFQDLWNALFTEVGLLFDGYVQVDADGPEARKIPFQGRLDQLMGSVIETTHTVNAEGQLVLSIGNVIESPVSFSGASVSVDGAAARLVGLDQPVTLASGERVDVIVETTAPFSDGEPEVALTLGEVDVALDRAAVLEAALQSKVVPVFRRPIKVKAFPYMFSESEGGEEGPLLALVVDIENAATVDLTAECLEATTEIKTPMTQLLTEEDVLRTYRYKLTVIRQNARWRDDEWRVDSLDILYPDPVRLV